MKLTPHYLKRYKDLALLFLKYSQPSLASKFEVEEAAAATNGKARRDAEKLPNDLERLGPTFIKLGQLLSSRPDILPPHYLKPLARLQDKVKPFPYTDVE